MFILSILLLKFTQKKIKGSFAVSLKLAGYMARVAKEMLLCQTKILFFLLLGTANILSKNFSNTVKPRNNVSVFEFPYVRQTFAENHSVYTSGTGNLLGIQ